MSSTVVPSMQHLAHASDFHSLYANVVSEWWRMDTDRFSTEGFKALGVLST